MKGLNLFLRLVLGGIFVYAGLTKILITVAWTSPLIGEVPVPTLAWGNPADFASAIMNFRMLPHSSVNLLAITLPWIEVLAGGMLMIGIWKRPNAILISVMLVIFLIAIGQAIYRGLDIHCGCFGTQDARKAGLTALVEDGAMLVCSMWLAFWYKD